MIEPKAQGPGGLQMLAGLGFGGARAFDHSISVSVILFIWGSHILPVFLKSINVREEAHLPTLIPYRATVTISMQVIESSNPFYNVEKVRQLVGSGINSGQTLASSIGGIL
jgi:hypothetical protein